MEPISDMTIFPAATTLTATTATRYMYVPAAVRRDTTATNTAKGCAAAVAQ